MKYADIKKGQCTATIPRGVDCRKCSSAMCYNCIVRVGRGGYLNFVAGKKRLSIRRGIALTLEAIARKIEKTYVKLQVKKHLLKYDRCFLWFRHTPAKVGRGGGVFCIYCGLPEKNCRRSEEETYDTIAADLRRARK